MHVIYVDAEKSALDSFRKIVENVKGVTSLHLFVAAKEALEWTKDNPVDVAFLDTEIGETQGTELAKQLKKINNNICVIFLTAHTQYAIDAFKIDALGYVLKPYSEADIKKELEKAFRMSQVETKKVEITTFPVFTVKVDGKVLRINNAKAKELLALFVERAGAGLTGGDVISYLWPDRVNDSSTQTLYRMTMKRLMDTLKEAGIEDIIGASGRERYFKTEKVDCDFYKVLDGDKEAAKYYTGESYLSDDRKFLIRWKV